MQLFTISPTSSFALFQLTRPVRGATTVPHKSIRFQLTRHMRGATEQVIKSAFGKKRFQLTRPVRGATFFNRYFTQGMWIFQLTRPVRGATSKIPLKLRKSKISTHAPRAGRNDGIFQSVPDRDNFNSRAPCGAQPIPCCEECADVNISTHAPRAGRNKSAIKQLIAYLNFNSRAPCGAQRHQSYVANIQIDHFNSRAPCGAQPPT